MHIVSTVAINFNFITYSTEEREQERERETFKKGSGAGRKRHAIAFPVDDAAKVKIYMNLSLQNV